MKRALGVGLLWAGWFAAVAAQHPSSSLERVSLYGRECVRLEDWARVHDFQVKRVSRQELRLANSRANLEFTVDSRKMLYNGISVWLSAPVAARNGTAHVAVVDVNTVLQPLLYPPRPSPKGPVSHICLDPGHGGKDPGNREGSRWEKKYTLLLAKEVGAQLTRAGFKVSYTRSSDRTVELAERTELARRQGADLLLSLHYNSADGAGGAAVKGVEVYCSTPAYASSTNARGEGSETGACPNNRFDARNILLAYQMQRWLVRGTGMEDRGVRRARFQVLRNAAMPAVMVEAGFMTHPTEAKRIYDAAHRQRVAQAMVDGLTAYKHIVDGPTAVARRR